MLKRRVKYDEELDGFWNFHLSVRKHFLHVRADHWSRLLREAVESPSLEILNTLLDMILGSSLWVTVL